MAKAEQAQRLGIPAPIEALALAPVQAKAVKNVTTCAEAMTSLTVNRSVLPLAIPLSPLERQADEYEKLFQDLEAGARAGRAAFDARYR